MASVTATAPLAGTSAFAGGEEWYGLDHGQLRYDPAKDLDLLPEAQRRLHEVRTGPATVRLVDRAGRPLAGVPLVVEQTGHDFAFGENLWEIDAQGRDGEWETGQAVAMRHRFAEIFNAANNLCYWTERPRHDGSKTEDRQGEWRTDNFLRTVDWTLAQGMRAKGHPLFWSIDKCIPEWVKRYDLDTFWKFAEVRVRNLVALGRGRMTWWDAVNEPMWEPCPQNLKRRRWPHLETPGDVADYIAKVIGWCRAEDPDALYLVNDYGMELDFPNELRGSDGTIVTAASQRARFRAMLRLLLDRGYAPDAVGLQSHTGWISPRFQWAIYDEFASTGLPVHITEFWASTKELKASGQFSEAEIEQRQADYIGLYLTCAFAHPAVEAFFFWGALGNCLKWNTRSGHDTTLLYAKLRQLIHHDWKTRVEVVTDADGVASFRGFFGPYAARYRIAASGAEVGLRFSHQKCHRSPVYELRALHGAATS